MSRTYGERFLVLWNKAEAMDGLELDPSRWKWVPEGSREKIAGMREKVRRFHEESVPLRFYPPRSRS